MWKKVRKTYRAGEPIRTVIFRKSIENIWILRISIQRLNFVKLCNDKGIKYCPMESKNVVDSGFIVSGTWFWNPWAASWYSRIPKPRIPDCTSNFLTDSGIRAPGYLIWGNKYIFLIALHVRKIFACGIGNPGLWDAEYSSRNPSNDWNPRSKFHLENPESMAWPWNPESKTVLDSNRGKDR